MDSPREDPANRDEMNKKKMLAALRLCERELSARDARNFGMISDFVMDLRRLIAEVEK